MIISYHIGLFGVWLLPNITRDSARLFYLWQLVSNHWNGKGMQKNYLKIFIFFFYSKKYFWTIAFCTQRVMWASYFYIFHVSIDTKTHTQKIYLHSMRNIMWVGMSTRSWTKCTAVDGNRTGSWERLLEKRLLPWLPVCLAGSPWEASPLRKWFPC